MQPSYVNICVGPGWVTDKLAKEDSFKLRYCGLALFVNLIQFSLTGRIYKTRIYDSTIKELWELREEVCKVRLVPSWDKIALNVLLSDVDYSRDDLFFLLISRSGVVKRVSVSEIRDKDNSEVPVIDIDHYDKLALVAKSYEGKLELSIDKWGIGKVSNRTETDPEKIIFTYGVVDYKRFPRDDEFNFQIFVNEKDDFLFFTNKDRTLNLKIQKDGQEVDLRLEGDEYITGYSKKIDYERLESVW